MNNNNRKLGYDYIRIMACFMVLVDHTFLNIVWPLREGYSLTSFMGAFVFFASKMNVVSFVWLSGALLLGKEESYKDWIVKRVLKIAMVIVMFSTMYYDWAGNGICDYLRNVFSANLTRAFWYLYLYLTLMILLPLIRKMCQNLGNKEYMIVIVVFILTQGVYPILNYYCNFPSMHYGVGTTFSYWPAWILAFVIGYFLHKCVEKYNIKFNIKTFVVLMISWTICNLIPTYITYRELYYYDNTDMYVDKPFMIWSIIATLCLNGMLLLIADLLKKYEKINRFISYISGLTFGIYLLGDKLIDIILPYFIKMDMNKFLKMFCVDVCVFVTGAIITIVLKQIPLIRKLL